MDQKTQAMIALMVGAFSFGLGANAMSTAIDKKITNLQHQINISENSISYLDFSTKKHEGDISALQQRMVKVEVSAKWPKID